MERILSTIGSIMTFSEAKREFNVRYYRWAISEFEKEVDEGLPTLRLFKAGGAWRVSQFMLKLSRRQQSLLARSLLKSSHPDAVATLGEGERCSPAEEAIRRQCDAQLNNILIFGRDLRARINAGEPIKLATRMRLRKAMMARFKAAFGPECVDLARADEDDEILRFAMKRAGWFVTTSFYFGRGKPVIDYSHGIASEEPLLYRPGIGPMVMASATSFNSCLGVSRGEWHYLTVDEVEPICHAVIKLCAHFFDSLPSLLLGLECENVIPDGVDIRGF